MAELSQPIRAPFFALHGLHNAFGDKKIPPSGGMMTGGEQRTRIASLPLFAFRSLRRAPAVAPLDVLDGASPIVHLTLVPAETSAHEPS